MNKHEKRRRSPLFFLLFVEVILGFALPVWQLRQQMRQAQINRQLVLAVNALDVPEVQDCLRTGADPIVIQVRTTSSSVCGFVRLRNGSHAAQAAALFVLQALRYRACSAARITSTCSAIMRRMSLPS